MPALARALLLFVDPQVREYVAGDLQEFFNRLVRQEEPHRAWQWSVRQAFAAALTNPFVPRLARRGGDGVLRTLVQDLRHGARVAIRQPFFSLVIVLTLGLAIGANTVIFSFANVLLLRPLPLRDPGRLGWIFTTDPQRGERRGSVSIPEFLDYRRGLTSFDQLAATSRGSAVLTGIAEAEQLVVSRVTANLMDHWGLRFETGRTFSNNADQPGAPGEVILSNGSWRTHLARDPNVVGRTMTIDGRPAQVVGILAPAIEIGNMSEIDVWLPLELSSTASRRERPLRSNGRLKPGVTIAQADDEVHRLAARLATEYPDTNTGWTARVTTTREATTGGDAWLVLTLLAIVVGLVLLIACANLGNLVLSAAIGRRRELAVRSALGASRVRLISQLLTENVVYGIVGGACGLVIAYLGLLLVKATSFDPFFDLVRMDRNVFVFTGILAILTPILFSVLPAWHSARTDVNQTLKDNGTRSSSGAPRAARSRTVLVVAQLSLAVMLVVLASLLVQALRNIENAPLGFDAPRLLASDIDLPAWRYTTAAGITDYYDRLLNRVRSTAKIDDAAVTDRAPLFGSESSTEVSIEGRSANRPEDWPWAVPAVINESFFPTIGVRVIAGRGFGIGDEPGRMPVAIVNSEMARRHWGTPERALGNRVSLAVDGDKREWLQIVGVVGDVLRSDREGVNPQICMAWRQRPLRSMTLLVRAADSGIAVGCGPRPDSRADPDVPAKLRRVQEVIDEDLSSSHVIGGLFAAFAILALSLAASGLYAVASYSAAQRTKEIGVRVALGASPGDIIGMMLRQTAVRVLTGAAIGLAGGRALAVAAASVLYRVSASDLRTYVGVTLVLAAIAFLATYLPARRATRVDPLVALRLE